MKISRFSLLLKYLKINFYDKKDFKKWVLLYYLNFYLFP